MAVGDLIGAFVLSVTGLGLVYLGYTVQANERAELIFPPTPNAPPERVARIGGAATMLVGGVTIGLGLALFAVPATERGWLVLLGTYTVICAAIAVVVRRRLLS